MAESLIQVSDDDYYSCRLTKDIPVRVLLVTINGNTGFGLLEPLQGGEESMKDYVRKLSVSPNIEQVDVTFKSKDVYWTVVTHRLYRTSIHETILQSGCMTRFPIVIEDGVQHHIVISPSKDAFGKLFRTMKKRFSSVKIRRTRPIQSNPFSSVLTKKQEEAVVEAFMSGYYDIPRKVDLTEVGRELGISRVAMQERLRRAEKRLLSEFIESYPHTHV